jgi:hypothetical protein
MQVGSASALNILRSTYSADHLPSADSAGSTRLKILQTSAKALETLRQNMTTSANAAKERAARKLEEANKQLEMLKSGGFPPEVVARLAAELAHKISAAASEFAAAVAASTTSAASSATASVADAGAGTASEATAAASAEAGSASAEDAQAGTDASEADEPDDATAARDAYWSVVEDGKQASWGISAEDRKTMEEFKSILQEVRQLLDSAMRELRARIGSPGSNADGRAQKAQVGAAQIPTSVII